LSMRMHFILDENNQPIEVEMEEWAMWLEAHRDECIVKQETLFGHVFVSTVFLGLNHNFMTEPPHIFETMVFPNHRRPTDAMCEEWARRSSTWDEALEVHAEAVQWAHAHYGQWAKFVEDNT